MHIPFTLLTNVGEPAVDPQNITVSISKDGGGFVPVECEIHYPGLGCYEAHLSESQLYCQQNALIHITADGCQATIFEYVPDDTAKDIAEEVWSARNRTLTSLSTGSTKASSYVVVPRTSTSSASSSGGLRVSQVFGNK